MKIILTIKNPEGIYYSGLIETPPKLKRFLLVNKNARRVILWKKPLRVEIRSSNRGEYQLECFVGYKRRNRVPMRAFRFKQINPWGKNMVTGRDFNTGKFIPWSCLFEVQRY